MLPIRPRFPAILPLAAASVLLGSCMADPDPAERYDLLGAAMRIVQAEYVEPVGRDRLIEGAVSGMLESLDPHSSYLNEQDFSAFETEASGEFGGIGIEIGQEEDRILVVDPIDDTPAARAGLRSGDVIVSIDGTSTAGMSLPDSVNRLRGRPGSSVMLGILRDEAGEAFDVTLTREIIEIDPVDWRLEGNIAYIRIAMFNDRTTDDLLDAVAAIRREAATQPAAQPAGYVLDLRDDPGGLLGQAVAVSDLFLEDGVIVSVRGRATNDVERFHALPGDVAQGVPIVVLINSGTASASEIVAGALQDHGRALILGTQSFGKGSVQKIIPVLNGGALRLTTARYYTPSGRSIQLVGISPDVVVEGDAGRPVGDREADLRNALANDTEAPPGPRQGAGRTAGRTAGPGTSDGETDPQLETALRMLRDGKVSAGTRPGMEEAAALP